MRRLTLFESEGAAEAGVPAVAVLVVISGLQPARTGEPPSPVSTPQQIEVDWLKQDEVRKTGKAAVAPQTGPTRKSGRGPAPTLT